MFKKSIFFFDRNPPSTIFFFFFRVIDTLPELYFKVMFKYITSEKNDLESTYKKLSIFVANSLAHYKNPIKFFRKIFIFHYFRSMHAFKPIKKYEWSVHIV